MIKSKMIKVINLLFVLPFGLYLNIFKTEKILQFWNKNIFDVRDTSFQRIPTLYNSSLGLILELVSTLTVESSLL